MDRSGEARQQLRRFAETVALGLALFPVCLLVHEVFHLAILAGLGGSGDLVVRPWRLQFAPLSLPSLHVTGGAGLDPLRRVAFDAGGPLLAALPLLVVRVLSRSSSLRAAAGANIAILSFFAVIETADYLLDARLGTEFVPLTWEEFNYGVPLLVVLFAAALAGGQPGRRVATQTAPA